MAGNKAVSAIGNAYGGAIYNAVIWTNQNEITYFQKAQFSDGGETFDDVVVSKSFDIPVDVYDRKMLYHLAADGKVMYRTGNAVWRSASLEQGPYRAPDRIYAG